LIPALAAKSIRRHPARTALAMAGVAVAAALLLDMVMLSGGMQASFRRFLLVQGFDLRIAPRGTLPMDTEATIGGAGEILRTLRANPDIAAATPVLGAQLHILGSTSTRDAGGLEAGPAGGSPCRDMGARKGCAQPVTSFAVGIDPETEADYQVEMGANAARPDRIVVNAAFLRATGSRLGDTLDVVAGFDPALRTYTGRRRLVIVGRGRFFYTSSDLLVAAVPITTLQAMGGTERADRASLFLAKVRDSVNADSVAAWVDRTIPQVSTLSTMTALSQIDERMGYFRQLALILGAVSLAVGFLLVTTLITVSVNERIGEIAVMRAIGVQKARVVEQIMIEGLCLTLVGAAVGLGLGLVAARFLDAILSDFPGLPTTFHFFVFQPSAAWQSLGLLVAAGALAGVYPSWRAASYPIAEALRREAIA
jgi:putative ABC transport system permease protein